MCGFFSEVKLDTAFPTECISRILAAEELRPPDIDVVALGLFGGANGRSMAMLGVGPAFCMTLVALRRNPMATWIAYCRLLVMYKNRIGFGRFRMS